MKVHWYVYNENAGFIYYGHMSKNNFIKTIWGIAIWLNYFFRQMLRQFVHGRGLQTASSLAYTTLLSIVPLIAVMFSFFGNFPVFKDISETIQEFVFNNFVPGFGQTVRDYLINFSVKASQLINSNGNHYSCHYCTHAHGYY